MEISSCLIRLPSSALRVPWARSSAPARERDFPYQRIKFLASNRSAGKKIKFRGEEHTVEELEPDAFDGVDLAIGSTPDEVARDFAPWAIARGCIVVDESGYLADGPQGAAGRARGESRRAINAPRDDRQPQLFDHANGRGAQAAARRGPRPARHRQHLSGHERHGRRRAARAGRGHRASSTASNYEYETFAHPIAFNLIPQIGSPKHQGYTSEEMKMVYETRKIIGDDSIQVCPTCVRVPVSNCHSESILVETERKLTVDEARELFAAHAGHRGRRRPGRQASIRCRTAATAATRCSSAAFARTCRAPTAWRSGA